MNKYPLIKFVIFFISGIIMEYYFETNISYIIYSCLIILLFAAYLGFYKTGSNVFQILLLINILFIGYLYSALFSSQAVKYPFQNSKYKNARIIGEISDIKLIRDERIVLEIESDSIITNEFSRNLKVSLLCNIVEKSRNKLINKFDELSIGNKILIEGNLQKGKEARNPGEFNYQKYLESIEGSNNE